MNCTGQVLSNILLYNNLLTKLFSSHLPGYSSICINSMQTILTNWKNYFTPQDLAYVQNLNRKQKLNSNRLKTLTLCLNIAKINHGYN